MDNDEVGEDEEYIKKRVEELSRHFLLIKQHACTSCKKQAGWEGGVVNPNDYNKEQLVLHCLNCGFETRYMSRILTTLGERHEA
jgi:RNase P subunit RPR2